MTPQMMLEIALCHAKHSPKFLRDEWGIPRFRVGSETDLLGIFIPLSLYYQTPKIESMNLYEVFDAGIWTAEELEVIVRIDHIQACYDAELWAEKIQELIDDYE